MTLLDLTIFGLSWAALGGSLTYWWADRRRQQDALTHAAHVKAVAEEQFALGAAAGNAVALLRKRTEKTTCLGCLRRERVEQRKAADERALKGIWGQD